MTQNMQNNAQTVGVKYMHKVPIMFFDVFGRELSEYFDVAHGLRTNGGTANL